MNTIVIDNLPEDLYRELKERASRRRRSVVDEATIILTDGIKRERMRKWPEPIKTRTPITDEFINRAKREGRE